MHYRIELTSGPAAGAVFVDTFLGRPATLQMGVGQWAPGVEGALLGHAEGEHFTVALAAAEAYGARNPELIQRVSRAAMLSSAPPDTEFEPGDLVEFVAPNGGRYSGVLKELGDTSGLFDFNHPLTGADLLVEIEILGVM